MIDQDRLAAGVAQDREERLAGELREALGRRLDDLGRGVVQQTDLGVHQVLKRQRQRPAGGGHADRLGDRKSVV